MTTQDDLNEALTLLLEGRELMQGSVAHIHRLEARIAAALAIEAPSSSLDSDEGAGMGPDYWQGWYEAIDAFCSALTGDDQ